MSIHKEQKNSKIKKNASLNPDRYNTLCSHGKGQELFEIPVEDKESLKKTIKNHMRLNSIDSRISNNPTDMELFGLLTKFPKMSHLLNLMKSSSNKVEMYRMKLKLANIEIKDLK